MKTFILFCCLGLSAMLLFAGSDHPDAIDSIRLHSIPEVVIEKNRISFYNQEKKTSIPDSLIREVYDGSNLGDILSVFTPAYVNASGSAGAMSSVFFRGHNSYQTSVNWNGFIINSLTLGTMDFSTVPVAAADNILVVHGAAGSIAGSGNSGGTVLMENRADWGNLLRFRLQSELGTYDNRHLSFSAKAGNPNIQYQLFLFSHQAENHFRYTDIFKNGAPEETIKNNSLDNKGLIHNIFARLPGGSQLEAGMWYQVKEKELPAIMGSYQPGNAMQRDSSFRVYAKWTRTGIRSVFSVNTAVFREYLLFRDRNTLPDGRYALESEISAGRLLGDIGYRIHILDNLSVEGGMTSSFLSADVTSYGMRANEQQLAAILATRFTLPGLTLNASARKEFHSHTSIPLLFSAGAAKRLPVAGMDLKLSFSEQFRVPSFNDKYWQPGGNPRLLPESGYTADLGLARKVSAMAGSELIAEASVFTSRTNNMIHWSPAGSGSWWSPGNHREVSVNGIETSVSSSLAAGLFRFALGGSHSYATSVISRSYSGNSSLEGNQLSYIPRHNASAYGNIFYRKAFAGFTGTFTGSRFTSDDNNPVYRMPPFRVVNLHAGYRVKISDVAGRLQLRVRNLFDSRYQVIRAYPMPGRSFHLNFSLEFNK